MAEKSKTRGCIFGSLGCGGLVFLLVAGVVVANWDEIKTAKEKIQSSMGEMLEVANAVATAYPAENVQANVGYANHNGSSQYYVTVDITNPQEADAIDTLEVAKLVVQSLPDPHKYDEIRISLNNKKGDVVSFSTGKTDAYSISDLLAQKG